MYIQKNLLASLLCALFSTTSFGVGPFNGFYASVGVGGETLQVDDDTTVHYFISEFPPLIPGNIDLIYPDSPMVTDSSVTGGIALGYSNVFNQLFLLGVEARANFEGLKTTYDYTAHTLSPVDLVVSSDDSVKLDNDFTLLIKLGVVLQPKTLIYGLVGPTWGNFDTSTHVKTSFDGIPTNISESESQYQTGWLAGLGIEYLMTDHFSFALEYTHADYGTFDAVDEESKVVDVTPGSFLSVNDDVNAKTDSVLLRLTYYFSANPTKLMKN